MKRLLMLLPLFLIAAACDSSKSPNVAQLQKENADLKEQVRKQQAADQFDLAAKCADRAALYWNARGFDKGGGQPNEMDSYTSHYNSNLNKCFILINQSWTTDSTSNTQLNPIESDDVLEGTNYANVLIRGEGSGWANRTVVLCWLRKDGNTKNPQRCKTETKFDAFVSTYMNN